METNLIELSRGYKTTRLQGYRIQDYRIIKEDTWNQGYKIQRIPLVKKGYTIPN